MSSERPTPEEVLSQVLRAHQSFRQPSAAFLLRQLAKHGYVIVHPDDVPRNGRAPDGLYGSTYDEAYEFGWNACRAHIFGDA